MQSTIKEKIIGKVTTIPVYTTDGKLFFPKKTYNILMKFVQDNITWYVTDFRVDVGTHKEHNLILPGTIIEEAEMF